MNKGFTLIETLVSLALLTSAVLFSARILVFALNQSRQSSSRLRMIETGDYYKNYLSSLPFSAPDLFDGSHRQISREFTVTWLVQPAEAGIKKINLIVAGAYCSLPLAFLKSHFIQEVKND